MIPAIINILLTRLFQLEAKVSELHERQVCKHKCKCVHVHELPISIPSPSSNSPTPTLYTSPSRTVIEKSVPGTVKWYNVLKGYGFITRTDTKQDVFMHKSGISTPNPAHKKPSLGQCEHVLFDVVYGRNSPEAINITGPRNAHVIGSKRNLQMETHDTSTTPAHTPSSVTNTCARAVNSSHRRSSKDQDSKPVTRRRRLLPKLPKTSKSSRRELSPRHTHELGSHRPEPTPPTELSQASTSIHGYDDMCYDTTD